MTKTIYVGNLPFSTSEEEVRELFSQHGTVHNVKLIVDRVTGRSRGFGFVDMDQDSIGAAIDALNGHSIDGRNLKVNEAKEQKARDRD